MIRSHLAQANRYIAEMRADIARERVIVEHALDAGYPSEVAESMLHTLEGALRISERHRELVLNRWKPPPSEKGDHPSPRPRHGYATGPAQPLIVIIMSVAICPSMSLSVNACNARRS